MAYFAISEKIETFISENLKIFGYDLNFLTRTPPPPPPKLQIILIWAWSWFRKINIIKMRNLALRDISFGGLSMGALLVLLSSCYTHLLSLLWINWYWVRFPGLCLQQQFNSLKLIISIMFFNWNVLHVMLKVEHKI